MEKEALMFDSKSLVKICYKGSLSWSRNYYEWELTNLMAK